MTPILYISSKSKFNARVEFPMLEFSMPGSSYNANKGGISKQKTTKKTTKKNT